MHVEAVGCILQAVVAADFAKAVADQAAVAKAADAQSERCKPEAAKLFRKLILVVIVRCKVIVEVRCCVILIAKLEVQLLKFLCTFGSKLSMKFPKVFPVVSKLSILIAKLSKLYWLLIWLMVVEVRCDGIVVPKLRLQLLKLLCTFSSSKLCLICLRCAKDSASSRKVC